MATGDVRVAAYGVCLVAGRLLVARYVSPDRVRRHWTLPGGKVEHAEDPSDAVVREAAEETGYQVEIECLLGVDSRTVPARRRLAGRGELHSVGIFYRVRVVGGELRHEVAGSTDLADWLPVTTVRQQARAVIVDVGLELDRTRPASGHVPSIAVAGLLRS
ncbi:NUDIX hydrolase [Micromonospora sp. NBC_01813]|uniref:NUDIX hydrolase n=1 Tax=Micromonospora sp. NBC_01813 TaxID=2975988 RepID=UPI002DDC1CEA|nr:NUDIX domain-containing protein [Micromonospora sp. NBC_01813]WSA09619.1 NUDIX domain-containing protein [Micromonospora sp. NBC_01813]